MASSNDRPASQSSIELAFLDAWYSKKIWVWLLFPLTLIYCLVTGLRRAYLTHFQQASVTVPVVVIGNITLGGTGKTPLLMSMIEHLRAAGFCPGVISRGYGGNPPQTPYLLDEHSTAAMAGDEPYSIFRRTGVPVCVGRDRIASAQRLIETGCNVIVSDDGLQHYRLARDIEIVVIDGQRGLGNRLCLPAGPLRETPARLQSVDHIILNSPAAAVALEFKEYSPAVMRMKPVALVNISTAERISITPGDVIPWLDGVTVVAVAGIGNPERFKQTLLDLQIKSELHAFADHHAYSKSDFDFAQNRTVIMTEKDAVKCREFAQPNWLYLEVAADLPASFWESFLRELRAVSH